MPQPSMESLAFWLVHPASKLCDHIKSASADLDAVESLHAEYTDAWHKVQAMS